MNKSNVEKTKVNSNYLRGTLKESLKNQITNSISTEDQNIIKFHGLYQQDDRDRREERALKKLEKLYSFMIRLRISGGKITADQWLGINQIAKSNANEVIKITTRQTVQLHGIFKSKIKPTIASFAKFNLDSISACGDVNRNVMSGVLIAKNSAEDEVFEFSKKISDHLLPKTKAYHEIWLDQEQLSGNEDEILYKQAYLPRKFKIAIALPPHNDVDIYSQDIGIIAIIENEILLGFNVLIGGGMGITHENYKTYPRLGSLIGFVEKNKILEALTAIVSIQRDYGNREDRKLSRFKYTIDKYGLEWIITEFEKRVGFKLQKSKDFKFETRGDNYGWHQDYHGNFHNLIFVENGRIFDNSKAQLKTALLEIAEKKLANFRFTNNQNIVISDISSKNKSLVKSILKKYQIDNSNISKIRLDAMACVALNTCPLALAEGQRYLPSLIDKIDLLINKHNLAEQKISIRMTGCPNGCARPYLAEIGLVGKSYQKYNLYLGASNIGDRLNKLYREDCSEEDILNELDQLFFKFYNNRNHQESFGDFTFREIL